MTLDDLLAALAGLPKLNAVERAARTPELIIAAQKVLAEIRREAVVEATAQGHDVGLSAARIRADAVPDRELLTAALRVLLKPGTTSAAEHQLAQGLGPRAPIGAVARRVAFGVSHLQSADLNEVERALINDASRRAQQILGGSA